MEKLDLSNIENTAKELGIELPEMKNIRWEGQDGQKYSAWEISTGGYMFHTGDGGAELFMNTFKKELDKRVSIMENIPFNLLNRKGRRKK